MKSIYTIILIFSVIQHSNAKPAPAYNSEANPSIDYSSAITMSQNSDKLILVVFGANWCKDCVEFDKQLNTKLKQIMDKHYIIVKVDVGEFDKNLDFVSKFGDQISKGIPSISIVDANKKLLFSTTAGEFASMRNIDKDSLYTFFDTLTKKSIKQ